MITVNPKNWKLLRPFFRGIPIIVVLVFLSLWMASWYIHHTIPMYESTVKIKLADARIGESVRLYKEFDLFTSADKIGTEVEMLKSKVLLAKTLDSIDMQTTLHRMGTFLKKELYHDAPFTAVIQIKNAAWYGKALQIAVNLSDSYRITVPDKRIISGRFGEPLVLPEADITLIKNTGLLKQKPYLPVIGDYEVIKNTREKTIDQLIDKLDVSAFDKDLPILRIIFKSPVPEKAADYVNILANTYLADFVASKLNAANITVHFLDKQLAEIAGKLAGSEDTLEDYRMDESIVNIRQETETDLRKIAQLKIELANLGMNLAAIDTLNSYIQKGKANFFDLAPNFEAFNDLLSTEMVKRIKQLQSERKDMLLRYTENDEKVKSLDNKLKDLTTYLPEAISNTRNNYEIKYREIKKYIEESEKAFSGLPTKEKRIAILERNFDLNEKLYNYLHQKKTEAEIARASPLNEHRIIADGEIPLDPVSPNKIVILTISALLGLMIGVFLIYMVQNFRAKVNDSDTIEKNSDTMVVAEVFRQRNDTARRIHFNDILIQLAMRKLINYPLVLTYTSFLDKEGKSYNVANLAKSMAAAGKNVLIVDVNGNTAEKQRWTLSNPDWEKIWATPFPKLSYYNAIEETTGQVVDLNTLQQKLNTWKSRFDAIVIRNGALAFSSNSLVYMAASDTNLFIMDAHNTPAKKIVEADLIKAKFNIPHMYFVLNKAEHSFNIITEIKEARQWISQKRFRPGQK